MGEVKLRAVILIRLYDDTGPPVGATLSGPQSDLGTSTTLARLKAPAVSALPVLDNLV